MNDAWGLYQTGLPDWAWQLAALVVFALSFARWLYSWDRERAPQATEPARTDDPARDDRRARQRVIQSLECAARCAGIAMADSSSAGRERAAERELPGIRAAILSANKLHGIPVPPEGRNAIDSLEIQRRMIEKILPFLKEGHTDEAQQEAGAFIARVEQVVQRKA